MTHSLQGVYSPLPQSLSDSDSEKEISMEPICTNYGNRIIKNSKLDNSCRQNGHLGFNNINDDILRIKRVNPKMSTLRKVAFVFSILLCFLPIIIFLWVLPCTDSNTCPVKISNWEYQQDNIELHGKINLVHGAFKSNLNLALIYKGSFNTHKSLKNGVISFMGNNGAVAWDFQQERYPLEMNCSIIDVDGNGYNDCLVIDDGGLKAIETITGEAIWHAHSVQEKSIPELDMPVKVGDFDNDGVSELLAIYKKESFVLISGKSGQALSNIKISTRCNIIANLLSDGENIKYSCKTSKITRLYEVSFSALKIKYNSHENLVPRIAHNEDKETVYKTGNRKLTVQNFDQCPYCRSVITIYGLNNTKTWSYQNAFVMIPVPFSFQSTKSNIISLKGHVNGFILKIWHWQEFSKKLPPISKVYKRSIPVQNETYYLNEISERVVLITFNETDTHVINASLTDIYQICGGLDSNNCQPDYKDQENSLLIADLDNDEAQELISYSSTYVKRQEDGNETWHLISYLKVFRLESELPKLYGAK